MTAPGLTADEINLIASVFERHPEVESATLFGSRAKGTHKPGSDVDLAVHGAVDDLAAEEIAAELDELPLPYRFDVKPLALIELAALREHIERVGIGIYSRAEARPELEKYTA
ncbi:nucleotidyltransferase domain-containing protein [soil metagenome]